MSDLLTWLRSLAAWKTVKDTGIHRYQVNTVTGRRAIIGGARGGYQPKDIGWLETGEWTVRTPPHTTPCVAAPNMAHIR